METVSPQYVMAPSAYDTEFCQSPERRPYNDEDYLSPDATLVKPGDIPSPPRKNPAHFRAIHRMFAQMFKLDDKIQEYGVEWHHCEELDGISQNLIDLDLGISTDLLIASREAFNEHWETFGSHDPYNFSMLFDCCCDILGRYLHPIPELV